MKVTTDEKDELIMHVNIDELNLILRALRYSWGGATFSQYNDAAEKLIKDAEDSEVLEFDDDKSNS